MGLYIQGEGTRFSDAEGVRALDTEAFNPTKMKPSTSTLKPQPIPLPR